MVVLKMCSIMESRFWRLKTRWFFFRNKCRNRFEGSYIFLSVLSFDVFVKNLFIGFYNYLLYFGK